MDATTLKPALDRMDWAAIHKYEVDEVTARAGPRGWWEPQQVAAAALHCAGVDGGPLFTWEDVREAQIRVIRDARPANEWLHSIAVRLASLLPPPPPEHAASDPFARHPLTGR